MMKKLDKKARVSWDLKSLNYDISRSSDLIYNSCINQIVSKAKESNGIILEAGCGTGMVTIPLSNKYKNIIALDFSLESIKILNKKLTNNNNAFTIQADICNIPFDDNIFDTVVCANTLQHLPPGIAQQDAASELIRVAKPNALIIVSVHHFSRQKIKSGWIKEGKPGEEGVDYIFRFSREELLGLFPGAKVLSMGFSQVNYNRYPQTSLYLQSLMSKWVGGMAAKLGHGHMLLACLRKG